MDDDGAVWGEISGSGSWQGELHTLLLHKVEVASHICDKLTFILLSN